jgi:uncharacterized membrane protein
VFGFAGLEIVVLFLLLRASFRRARSEEGVRVAGDTTTISRDGAVQASLQSYWLRIEADAYGSARGLMLRSRGQQVAVGAGLHAHELNALASALHRALHRVKTEPAPG